MAADESGGGGLAAAGLALQVCLAANWPLQGRSRAVILAPF